MSTIADLLGSSGDFGADRAFQSTGGFIQGTVTDNSDKKYPGMVKVEFTAWKSGSNIYEWLPVLQGFAGGKYGAYAIPEVGDIVLVGFIGAGMKRPFVLGSLYPANAKMVSESYNEKNTVKRFRTKAGTALSLNDEKGKESAAVTTPKGLTLIAEDEKETITAKDKNGKNIIQIDCKKGGITITADSKITVKTGKCEIAMDGKGGALSIKCDRLNIKAAQQATVASNQMMTVQGNILKAEGKQTAQFKGGTLAELSAGMVKIN